MSTIFIAIAFIIGFLLGALMLSIIKNAEQKRTLKAQYDMQNTFSDISRKALLENNESFMNLAKTKIEELSKISNTQLEDKKKVIDLNINNMKEMLYKLEKSTDKLNTQMGSSNEAIDGLKKNTEKLREILSSSQKRGQWGEKMVEDILNFIGLKEDINYLKQKGSESRPDYTFLLPKDKVLNLDVKFPLDHYQKYIEAENPAEKEQEVKLFLDDVKNCIKSLDNRNYIDPDKGTVDFILLFIPNESVYYFINEKEKDLIDFALKRKIVLCSPVTLYAVLSLIHQAASNFSIEKRAGEIQQYVQSFKIQWDKFKVKMDDHEKQLNTAMKTFDSLQSTRIKALEKPMTKIVEMKIDNDQKLVEEDHS